MSEPIITTEWAVQYREGAPLTVQRPFMYEVTPLWTEETARHEVSRIPDARLFKRTRIHIPDEVSEWKAF